MKSYLQFGDYALWIGIAVFQCWIFAAALKAKISRQLFWFVVFLGFVSLRTLVLLWISQRLSYPVYFYSYYSGLVVEGVIVSLLAHNFFMQAFAPLNTLRSGTLLKLVIAISFLITVAICLAFYRPAASTSFLLVVIETANRTLQFSLCAALWVIAIYARMLGIPWRCRIGDIISGFLLFLTVQFVDYGAAGFLQTQSAATNLGRVTMVAYLVALVFWQAAFLQKEVQFQDTSVEELQQLNAVWQNMRKGFVQR